jgi:hypothetical protein
MILQSDTYHFYCTRMLERGNPGEKTLRRSRALLGRGSGHIVLRFVLIYFEFIPNLYDLFRICTIYFESI